MQPLEAGERAPYAGALVPYELAAELVVSASVARTIHQIELGALKAGHVVEMRAQQQIAEAAREAERRKQEILTEKLRLTEEALTEANSWTRSPLLWFGVGVLSSFVFAGSVKLILN